MIQGHSAAVVALVLLPPLLATLGTAVRAGLAGYRHPRLGPADGVTLARGVLTCGVAALVAGQALTPGGLGAGAIALLVALAAVALVLDHVDGQVARRTGTCSAFGARFDLEVDALLILVLSVYVAGQVGWWVLGIGLARYLFVAARRTVPALRGAAPSRYWCKVVAVVQGVMLTVAAAGVLPVTVASAGLLVALVLLIESFGREAWQLWRSDAVIPAASGAVVITDAPVDVFDA
jgi:phosphatidylglycerophosphate synthase